MVYYYTKQNRCSEVESVVKLKEALNNVITYIAAITFVAAMVALPVLVILGVVKLAFMMFGG